MSTTSSIMDVLRPYIGLLIPLLIIQLGLTIAALVDWIKRPTTRGPKWVWLIIILLVSTIGPLAYLVFGREEE